MNAPLRLLLVLATLAFTASQASAIPGLAEVIKVIGTATVSKATGGAPTTLAAGMVLGTGDTIATGPSSTVDLNLGVNGDFLRVDPDTSLNIDNLDIANVANRTVTTQLKVNRGGITGNVVNKLTLASKYEIKSASGVAGIRGTIYSVKTDANGRITRIVVTSGTVTFSQGGVTVTISAGQALTPPPAGTPLTQAQVGPATRGESVAVSAIGRTLAVGEDDSAARGLGTVFNNPADVSTSQKQ